VTGRLAGASVGVGLSHSRAVFRPIHR
jgi:hypothetical protein